ncbi:hypothetical protein TNCV_4764881 [Trichonephila clavipes]|nr:hypothetical protein TNCV_4764881 [Trichonephila clavipes]
MITNFFIPELNNHDVQELWFQQDGATCHTARATIDLLRHSLVYADKPQTLDHLEDNIRRVIADIRPQMLEKVIENWTCRLDYIRASRGSPMPEIIFKMWVISHLQKQHVTQNHFCLDVDWITIRPLVLVTSRAVDFEAGAWRGNSLSTG